MRRSCDELAGAGDCGGGGGGRGGCWATTLRWTSGPRAAEGCREDQGQEVLPLLLHVHLFHAAPTQVSASADDEALPALPQDLVRSEIRYGTSFYLR